MQLYKIFIWGACYYLPEEAVNNLGTVYMEAEYITYEYEKKKGVVNEPITFCYRQAEFLLAF